MTTCTNGNQSNYDDNMALYHAVKLKDKDAVRKLITEGMNPNRLAKSEVISIDGSPVIFAAILNADIPMIELLLALGAKAEIVANEPACDALASTPLNLARQLRFFLDASKYDPIVKLIEMHLEAGS
jgi:ankyrin repeat protein